MRKVVEEEPDLHRAYRHGQRRYLVRLILSRPRLPCNCKAVVRSGLAGSCEGSPRRDQVLGFPVKHTGVIHGMEEILKLLHVIRHVPPLSFSICQAVGRVVSFPQDNAKQIPWEASLLHAPKIEDLIPGGEGPDLLFTEEMYNKATDLIHVLGPVDAGPEMPVERVSHRVERQPANFQDTQGVPSVSAPQFKDAPGILTPE